MGNSDNRFYIFILKHIKFLLACFIIYAFLLLSCKQPKSVLNNWPIYSNPSAGNEESFTVQEVPSSLQLDTFYKKYLSAQGIPIISSEKVPDAALIQAKKIMIYMLREIPEVIPKLIENRVRISVMSIHEVTTDIPEHKDLNEAFPSTNWDIRARGLSATLARPATSCAEENLLCYSNDPYNGEDILIHEFAHTIHEMGISFVDRGFNRKVYKTFQNAKSHGLWKKTYAMTNALEYFAEGVQCWFNLNKEAIPPDGVHNEINTREELKIYDSALYNLIKPYFVEDDEKISCQRGS